MEERKEKEVVAGLFLENYGRMQILYTDRLRGAGLAVAKGDGSEKRP